MDHSRPDGFVLGQDPEEKVEQIARTQDGCTKCHREWPSVTFKKWGAQVPLDRDAQTETLTDLVCDSCWPSDLSKDIAAKIDEATETQPAGGLIRAVEVTGIESRTNVVSFKYATHVNGKELVTTLLTVGFKTKIPGEFTWYTYREVPVAVCESWFAAPAHGHSFGAYFRSFIRSSYDSERKV